MKKLKKMMLLLAISLSVYIIFLITNQNKITYLALGDSLTYGQDNYGGKAYGYTLFLNDYFNSHHQKTLFIDQYAKKNHNIRGIQNDILSDKTVIVDNHKYNLKRLLQEANIITMSIGLNDIIYEYSLNNKYALSAYEEDRIIKSITEEYKKLLDEISIYNSKPIFIVGYSTRNKYASLLEKLNNSYKIISKNYNNIFIDVDKILNSDIYFDEINSIFPNYKGYEKIANTIIDKYENLNNR